MPQPITRVNPSAFFVLGIATFLAACLGPLSPLPARADQTIPLEQRLENIDVQWLAREARLRGNPKRGAIEFFTSAAACANCHHSADGDFHLGPDLATIGQDTTDEHIVESLLHPSRVIRKGYQIARILTVDGRVLQGLPVRETDEAIVLRDTTNLTDEISVAKDDIESRSASDQSLMPDEIISLLGSEASFLDLASYVMEIAGGGPDRAAELMPSRDHPRLRDDAKNLDHAGILASFQGPAGKNAFRAGREIFDGYCAQCHGADGNTPTLATARAFGTQKLKFGSDPYSMFTTLSRGNGLMAATRHLSPKERYQVVHYVRQRFMKGSNPGYQAIDDAYLDSLPKGTEQGDFEPAGERDFGPALASQLGRDVTSALTIKLDELSLSYNLHSLDQADLWQGEFLDLEDTHHFRGRGEGYAMPGGRSIEGLAGWRWGHDGTLDYPAEDLRPRGPMPERWLTYHGHSLHGDDVVLRYAIDGREILESPQAIDQQTAIRHTMNVGPGNELLLCVAEFESDADSIKGFIRDAAPSELAAPAAGDASGGMVMVGSIRAGELDNFTAAKVLGDPDGLRWTVDDQGRMVLRIPADTKSRRIEVVRWTGRGRENLRELSQLDASGVNPESMLRGGSIRWPGELETVGYLGFETGPYAVDTIAVPDSTPWNTWFRTSAIDFFPDGRMAVATMGGDVWIVSGVNEDLLDVRWKRFAAGMYEPFGIKVVDGDLYVTCKDRLTRLHDLNDDGEADFYESFSADTDVSSFFHAFNFDLQTDSKGNFYYAKSGQYTDYALPGAVIKVSPDGTRRSVVCTGLRTPNGMGILPDDRLTVSDNQGTWMPASKINLVRPGGFYGYVQNKASGAWAPDGGRIDHKQVVPPETFDPPIIWMPQDIDNSSGGQVWIDDDRWGPLSGHLLHTSFGKGWMFRLFLQEVSGQTQAALVRLPHDFRTGIMRGRVNPADGQVYVVGLDGWNGNGRPGLVDHGIERVRYTGEPVTMIQDCRVTATGLRLTFNVPIDASSVAQPDAFEGQQWNYHWTGSYGSDFYHPVTDQVGTQDVQIVGADLSADRKTVDLNVANLMPVDQMHLHLNLSDDSGNLIEDDVYWTIHGLPQSP